MNRFKNNLHSLESKPHEMLIYIYIYIIKCLVVFYYVNIKYDWFISCVTCFTRCQLRMSHTVFVLGILIQLITSVMFMSSRLL